MPIVPDPDKLTKVKLKEELQRYNVKLPPANAKKQAYVDLYNQHISNLNDPGLFEEDFTEQSLVWDKSSENETALKEVSEQIDSLSESAEELEKELKKIMNVEDLSDKELADELRSLGFNPGPIGVTTRRVYEKKLVKLRQGSPDGDSIKVSPKLFQQTYDEVPDDEDKQPPAKPRSPKKRLPPRRVFEEEPVEEPIEQQIKEEPVLTRRPLTAKHDRTREPTERSKAPPAKETIQKTTEPTQNRTENSGGIPLWIKFTIFLLVAFFVYLVIANMEPSADSKIPKSITDES